ncbi:hypothetical protein L1049_014712 [Liquidambar formosana]|uniref:Transcription factor GTE7-like n=1 Tax=Liquidambar formosana TaxID=63359 RepID=A0AAP0S2Q1_LIQFO
MASAVLASRNESFMGKTPFSNPHLISNPNPNPNPNPNSNHKRRIHAQTNGRLVDELPAVNQTVSDDASSFNRRSFDSSNPHQFNQGGYVTFNIASYTRKELNELKKRLVAELDQIRSLTNRIESGELELKTPNFNQSSKNFASRNEKKHSNNKKIAGTKRSLPVGSGRDLKRSASENGALMRMCGQLLTKLMKHKHGWIFNSPVDVVGMGLHDYYQIVKHPMDLGTVKSKFGKNLYESPMDFAADVRLTFNNALLYNPKGHDVYAVAEQLLARFEEMFQSVSKKLEDEQPPQQKSLLVEELQGSSWSNISTPERAKKPVVREVVRKPERVQVPASASNPPPNPPSVQSPVPTPSPKRVSPVKPVMRTKQPKPKAKDPNKREMSIEEKQRLGLGLQSLPEEKMTQVVQIIRKRNGNLTEDGDEIELDIEAVDTETLWELDRFVTNWKKMVSKIKRQALMGSNTSTNDGGDMVHGSAEPNAVASAKKPKKGEAGDEDVDIGDEIPMSSFPPVEIEKDDGHATSSSSSSSSSGSDSSSSSGI